MRRTGEFFFFVLIAIALHVALFVARSDAGADAGGVGGEAMISIEAATPTVEEMVEAWERQADAPPLNEADLEMQQPDAPQDVAPPPSIELADAPNAELQVARVATPDRETLEMSIERLNQRPLESQPQLDTLTLEQPEIQPTPELPQEQADRPTPQTPRIAALRPPDADSVRVDTVPAEPTKAAKAAPAESLRPVQRPEAKPATQPQQKSPEPQPQTAQKADQTSQARAGQKAAGSGGGTQAGNAGQAQTATLSKGQKDSLKAVWGSKIRAKIERAKRYPRGENASGKVSVRLSVSRTGQLLGVSVRRSSGHPKLDAAAVASVKRAKRFPKAPKGLTASSYTFTLSMVLKR
ncbi:MAG: TonB family protein [Pseudomonadota bacterium]